MLDDLSKRLKEKGLRVTPQRLAILDSFTKLNHPTAENIIDFIHRKNPNIAAGTVYKVLETLVENGMIQKVKTEHDSMRYDAVLDQHHHLYCSDSDRIEDFYDEGLNNMIGDYFKKKAIPGFRIEDIKLQIIGKFVHP